MKLIIALIIVVVSALGGMAARADDGADSISTGGIVVMGREPRIVMAKEVLRISYGSVVVDYDFRNDTDHDVTTGVAFPIPDYDLDMGQIDPQWQGFDDFHLWINGSPFPYKVQARAIVKGKDLTAMLSKFGIDVGSFGHATSNDDSPQIQELTTAQRSDLQRAGLVDEYGAPLWKVRKKYYWTMTFPAHKTIHVRHRYTAVMGSENSIRYALGPEPSPEAVQDVKSFCMPPPLETALKKAAYSKDLDSPYFYVDFILTTANTWKKPIEDFQLIVERQISRSDLADYVSFCWDGPIKKIDADHYSASATNFIPKHELHIGFFEVIKRAH